MGFFINNFEWVLYVTGVLTATVGLMAVAPAAQFKRMFGAEISDPRLILVARQFGIVVGTLGLLLIYAGYDPTWREPVLWFAIISKAALVAQMAINLKHLQGTTAIQVIVADVLMVLLYVAYLVLS